MKKSDNLHDLAHAICQRSSCNVRVGCVLEDAFGVFSWGWNNPGADGMGEHAESAAIRRANRRRLKGATAYTVAMRRGKMICSFPCPDCFKLLKKNGIARVWCYDEHKQWQTFLL